LETADIPNPIPAKGQVVVEVYAASINPFDQTIREGYLKDKISLQFPVTLGGDLAGVVTEVGEGVIDLRKGDEIYGSAIVLNKGSGAFAEYASVNIANSGLKPKRITFEEAAALPLVGSSAVQALEEHIKLQSAQKILIHGGAGGIGSIAIQLAKALGAYVATTVGTDDIQFVKDLGADEVIDYKTQKFEEILKEFDAVFDMVGRETTDKSFTSTKKRRGP
jgi:NADPH:quinone reductase and related Zn-dependent oxidoreductases